MLNFPKKDLETLPNSLSLGFVEGLYADYLDDPASQTFGGVTPRRPLVSTKQPLQSAVQGGQQRRG